MLMTDQHDENVRLWLNGWRKDSSMEGRAQNRAEFQGSCLIQVGVTVME